MYGAAATRVPAHAEIRSTPDRGGPSSDPRPPRSSSCRATTPRPPIVTGLPTGSILGEISDTEVWLSDPAAPQDALFRVRVSPQQPGVVDVDAGTYNVLNTNRGGIEVEACPDVTLSDVETATPGREASVSP